MKKKGKAKTAGTSKKTARRPKKAKPSRKPASTSKKGKKPTSNRKPKQPKKPPIMSSPEEVPTLEQVTITCANCGKPFKVMKLTGLSLEGTLCQRCNVGEIEPPEGF
jgi:hypothetical protein